MKVRYLTLDNGERYLITTGSRIHPSWDVVPTEYNSYITASEAIDANLYAFPNPILGRIVNGNYTGLLGTYHDMDDNEYKFEFDNGTFTATLTSSQGATASGSISRDCFITFNTAFPMTSQDEHIPFGISWHYPWDGGSTAGITAGSIYATVSMEASFDDLISMSENKLVDITLLATNDSCKWYRGRDGQVATVFGITWFTSSAGGINLRIGDEVNGISIENSISDLEIDEDPYNDHDESHSGGGGGNHDNSSDPIDFPSLPTLSAVDTGLVTIYNPSVAEIRNLADYMWSNLFDLDTFKKLFADPMDAILGLSIVPVNVPSGSSQVVKIGNVSTGISMTKAARQYVEVDCGSITAAEYWGAYLDYEPFTKFELYLPYIGTRQISADDCMKKTIHIKYHIDILSGACVAYVKCGDAVLYSFQGQCSCEIPISNVDWSQTIIAALEIATAVGTMVAVGGPAAPALGASAKEIAASEAKEKAYRGRVVNAAGSAASSAMNVLKPNIEKSGGFGSMGGMLGIQKPYLIITRPKQAVPGNQNAYQGYPSFITVNLGTTHGYTEVDSIVLDHVTASDVEIAEIVSLLQGGVFL